VTLGIIPDFSYRGRGYRISGVVKGSPADEGRLRDGDVIVSINSQDVNSLKEISDILKSLSPGARIKITFLREGKEMSVEIGLVAR
jgi:S1-C subfamily serine protease